jgi:hypothetical protein
LTFIQVINPHDDWQANEFTLRAYFCVGTTANLLANFSHVANDTLHLYRGLRPMHPHEHFPGNAAAPSDACHDDLPARTKLDVIHDGKV